MNEKNVAYRNKLILFWLQICIGISYSAAKHFTFKPVRPLSKTGAHFIACAPGRREPQLCHYMCQSVMSLVMSQVNISVRQAAIPRIAMNWSRES